MPRFAVVHGSSWDEFSVPHRRRSLPRGIMIPFQNITRHGVYMLTFLKFIQVVYYVVHLNPVSKIAHLRKLPIVDGHRRCTHVLFSRTRPVLAEMLPGRNSSFTVSVRPMPRGRNKREQRSSLLLPTSTHPRIYYVFLHFTRYLSHSHHEANRTN